MADQEDPRKAKVLDVLMEIMEDEMVEPDDRLRAAQLLGSILGMFPD